MAIFGFGKKNKKQSSPNYLKNYLNSLYSVANNSNYYLSLDRTLELYEQCSPFFMVIDKIVSAYISVPFVLKDTKTGEFITEHPVLDLLKNPSSGDTEYTFKEQLASSFLITGNCFLLATGNVNNPPLEVYNLSPRFFSTNGIVSNPYSFTPEVFRYSNYKSVINFTSQETLTGLRYYKDDIQELYHIKRFNALQSQTNVFGMSKGYPLMREIEQYVSGNINNISLLKRGARPSMAWVNNRGEELTEQQWERLTEEARKYSGSENAGGTPILDGMDAKELGQSNRDMQFKEMQESMITRIANVYGVPIALLVDSAMTLNNLQTARLLLDKDAVIPLAKRINEDLTRFLLPRYDDTENLEFSIDLTEVESLKPEVLANAQAMASLRVNTIDEIRTEIGYENLEEGGDELVGSVGSISFDDGEDERQDDQDSQQDQLSDENEEDEQEKAYQFFYKEMKNQKISDEEIKALWTLSSK